MLQVIENGKELDPKYKNHILINDNTFKNCNECHITSNWLLVYKIENDKLILLLFDSHSNLFRK